MWRMILIPVIAAVAEFASAGPLDEAILHGETDRRRAIEYADFSQHTQR